MSKLILSSIIFFCFQSLHAQVILNADGQTDTYSLITSVLAPGHNPIEVPDCNHEEFGDHIDQVFDDELNQYVFRFHIHTEFDDDRCINFDRQRNEIKSYSNSPANLKGVEDETVIYKWQFKLAEGFQTSPNFTHIHQLKSVGGSLASMPIYTLTTRKGTPDQLELRYAETTSQVTLKKTDLAPFIGSWIQVTETIRYGVDGTYDIIISSVNEGTTLFEYSTDSIINWREGADFVRPKWGIYRSLLNAADLRDEMVLYANFSVEELEILSNEETATPENEWLASFDPFSGFLTIQNLPADGESIRIYSNTGQKIHESGTNFRKDISIDLSRLTQGVYIIQIENNTINSSKKIVVSQ